MPTKNKKDNQANRQARPVKGIVAAAKTVLNDDSVKDALDEMKTRQTDSSLVINRHGELLGTVSKDRMHRKVGGLGHDPETEVVQAQLEPTKAECFEDQTLAEARHLMLDAKVTEIAVVRRAKLLVGTTNLEAIARQPDDVPSTPPNDSGT